MGPCVCALRSRRAPQPRPGPQRGGGACGRRWPPAPVVPDQPDQVRVGEVRVVACTGEVELAGWGVPRAGGCLCSNQCWHRGRLRGLNASSSTAGVLDRRMNLSAVTAQPAAVRLRTTVGWWKGVDGPGPPYGHAHVGQRSAGACVGGCRAHHLVQRRGDILEKNLSGLRKDADDRHTLGVLRDSGPGTQPAPCDPPTPMCTILVRSRERS